MFGRYLMFLPVAALFAAACSDTSTTPNSVTGPVVVPSAAIGTLSGAIFTSNEGCTVTNQNMYASKDEVYLSGGPETGQIPLGEYYVRVVAPGGGVLGESDGLFNVTGCRKLSDAVFHDVAGDQVAGFLDTTNPAGEYKLDVCTQSDFRASSCKSDNFKIAAPAVQTAMLTVVKFYDFNANGTMDAGEVLLTNWKFSLAAFEGTSDQFTTYTLAGQVVGSHFAATEYLPVGTTWVATKPFDEADLASGGTTLTLGNYCTIASGGYTLGFWSNKNGKAVLTLAANSGWMTALNGLGLKGVNGAPFTVTSYDGFRTWILGANSVDATYMLSAQLAAMKLNVLYKGVLGSSYYVPAGMTIQQLMDAAKAALAMSSPPAGYTGTLRDYQLQLKTWLDQLNNGASVIPATPCAVPTTWNAIPGAVI